MEGRCRAKEETRRGYAKAAPHHRVYIRTPDVIESGVAFAKGPAWSRVCFSRHSSRPRSAPVASGGGHRRVFPSQIFAMQERTDGVLAEYWQGLVRLAFFCRSPARQGRPTGRNADRQMSDVELVIAFEDRRARHQIPQSILQRR
jgi:hypothetical protein